MNYLQKGPPSALFRTYHLDRYNCKQIEERLIPNFLNLDKEKQRSVNPDATSTEAQASERVPLYGRKRGLNKRESQNKWNDFPIQNRFKHSSGFSTPWINDSLRTYIHSQNENSVFKDVKIPSSAETRASDQESIRNYTSVCRSVPRHLGNILWSASIAATAHLGLHHSSNERSKFLPLEANVAVNCAVNDANAGYPTFKKKNTKVAINDATTWLNKVVHKPNIYSVFKNILLHNPKILLHRFQPKLKGTTLETKCRQVWCEPFRIISLENYFFRNVIDRSADYNRLGNDVSSSNGLRNSEISAFIIYRMRNLIGSEPDKKLFSLDYKAYDASIPDFFIDLYFYTMREFLVLDSNESKLYDLLRYYTKYGPIVHDNKVHFKRKGISSGSLLTNHFDSWLNLVLQYVTKHTDINDVSLDDISNGYFGPTEGVEYRKLTNNAVTGDDVIIYTTQLEIYRFQEVCKYFGMTLLENMSTNNRLEDFFFLGRYWNRLSEPYQTEAYMTAHICYRTKFYKKNEIPIDISEELEACRILSICCPFVNGMEYVYKSLSGYKPLENLMQKRKFLVLKDYPSESRYQFKNIDSVYNWRMF